MRVLTVMNLVALSGNNMFPEGVFAMGVVVMIADCSLKTTQIASTLDMTLGSMKLKDFIFLTASSFDF